MGGELDPRVIQSLSTKTEITNYVRSVIAEAKMVMSQRPSTALAMTDLAYVRWERRLMIKYGMAAQSVVDAHVFGLLSLEEMLALQKEVTAILLVTSAEAQLGTPR
jgi:hypothetical protein